MMEQADNQYRSFWMVFVWLGFFIIQCPFLDWVLPQSNTEIQFGLHVYFNKIQITWKLPFPWFLLYLSSVSNFVDWPNEQVVGILYWMFKGGNGGTLSNWLSEQLQLWINLVFVTSTFDMIYYCRSSFYRAYFLWIVNGEEFDPATCSFGVRSYPCPSKLTWDVIAIQSVCPRDLPFDRSVF